jgi:predicted outer membrane protein
VKKFGQRMADDHGKANDELKVAGAKREDHFAQRD